MTTALTPPRKLRVYRAENAAAAVCDVPLLDGTHKAAQSYVDRITRSAWWRRTCPPSWLGDSSDNRWIDASAPPSRVIVKPPFGRSVGGHAGTKELRKYRGKWYPHIGLGTAECTPGRPAIADPWVILHELAHIMSAETDNGHGREFARYLMLLVRRWLGPDAAAALRAAYAQERVKYRAR